MKKQILGLCAFVVFASPAVMALSQKKVTSKPVTMQTVQIQLDGLKDCQSGPEEFRKMNLNPEDMCLIEVKGYESKKAILMQAKVGGVETAPYVGNREQFEGKLVYFKKHLPQEGAITLDLMILGEKPSTTISGKINSRIAADKNQ